MGEGAGPRMAAGGALVVAACMALATAAAQPAPGAIVASGGLYGVRATVPVPNATTANAAPAAARVMVRVTDSAALVGVCCAVQGPGGVHCMPRLGPPRRARPAHGRGDGHR